MKCGNIPLLWRKFFLNIAINRDHVINYCNRPNNKIYRPCQEWYLSHNSDDNQIRMLDNNLNIDHTIMW